MKLNLIPQPKKVELKSGFLTNNQCPVNESTDSVMKSEAYTILISADSIEITAGDSRGIFYAHQTIKQLREAYNGAIPCCRIDDEPSFEYRGFMLDCARHSFTVDEIKKIIDELALLKINYLHWHLTDDQGWRIEIEKYPELIKTGASRSDSCFDGKSKGTPYSAYFTKAELKEITDYCKERYITVIPEIDIPGHTSALVASYPELSCDKSNVEVKTRGGIYKDILCAGNENTYNFVIDVIDEILDIFPSKYIHIGGDEVPKQKWTNCQACQKVIEENKLNNEDDLQAFFMKRVIAHLKDKGRCAIVWNDSIKSNLLTKDDVIVQRWMERGGKTQAFANNAGKFIESDFFHYYCDYPYGFTPLDKTYNYNPYIKGLENTDSLYGIEAPVWTEYINNFNRLCYMIFPRLLAFSETAWNAIDKDDYDAFSKRAEKYLAHFNKVKINYAPIEDWSPAPAKRLGETLSFFKPFLSGDIIKDFLKGTFRKNK